MTVIDRFKSEYQDYHRISKERAGQQRALVADFIAGLDYPVENVTSADFQAFAGRLMARGYHVNTVRKKLNMMRAFFGWAYAVGVITGDQYLQLKQVKDPRGATGKTTPNPYSSEEIQAFWAALDTSLPRIPLKGRGSQALRRWRTGKGPWRPVWRHAMRLQVECAVRLALDLGMRRAEMYELSVDDLHYDNEYIVIAGKGDPHTGEAKVRTVPYTADAREAVYHWVEMRSMMHPKHSSAWLSCYSEAYNHPMYEDRFHTLLPAVVGKGWRWHRFRHTCGTEWLRAGMELAYVSKLLGHASLQQTLAYAEIAKGDVARHVARHEEAFSLAVRRAA